MVLRAPSTGLGCERVPDAKTLIGLAHTARDADAVGQRIAPGVPPT